jgi:hypothetical protein
LHCPSKRCPQRGEHQHDDHHCIQH